MVTLVWGGGEGVLGEGSPPLLVFNYSKEALRPRPAHRQPLPHGACRRAHRQQGTRKRTRAASSAFCGKVWDVALAWEKGRRGGRDAAYDLGAVIDCLRQGTSKRGRQSANQPVRQASSQSGSPSGKQAGREAGRSTQFGFFSVADYEYKHWGTRGLQEHSVVEWSNTRQTNRLASVRISAGRIGRSPAQPIWPLSPFLYSTLVQILLSTNF